MNVKELRIGNYLRDERSGVYLRVSKITEEIVTTYATDRSISPLQEAWEAEAVPLSYDLLVWIGFIDVMKNGWGCRMNIGSIDELCYYCQDGSLRYQTRGGGFTRDFNIKYLHQLQNLYYVLTGEELDINL